MRRVTHVGIQGRITPQGSNAYVHVNGVLVRRHKLRRLREGGGRGGDTLSEVVKFANLRNIVSHGWIYNSAHRSTAQLFRPLLCTAGALRVAHVKHISFPAEGLLRVFPNVLT